jgi:hypothetical protein
LLKKYREDLQQEHLFPKWVDSRTKNRIVKVRQSFLDELNAAKAAYVRSGKDSKADALKAEIIEFSNRPLYSMGIDRRNVWKGNTTFKLTDTGEWEEWADTKIIWRFRERSRNPEFVELIDFSRNSPHGVKVHLYPDQAIIWVHGAHEQPSMVYQGAWYRAPNTRRVN